MLNVVKKSLLTILTLLSLLGVVSSNATADDLNKGFVELTEGRPAGAEALAAVSRGGIE